MDREWRERWKGWYGEVDVSKELGFLRIQVEKVRGD
jgi:hypothetical protein